MPNIFLTNITLKKTNSTQSSYSNKNNSKNQVLQKLKDELKEISTRLKNEKKEYIQGSLNKLKLDKQIFDIINKFAIVTADNSSRIGAQINNKYKSGNNQDQNVKYLVRSLTRLQLLQRQISRNKYKQRKNQISGDNYHSHNKFTKLQQDTTVDHKTAQNLEQDQIFRQLNYRVYQDKVQSSVHLQRKQLILGKTVDRLARNNKLKQSVTRKKQEQQSEHMSNILSEKENIFHANYSIWGRTQYKKASRQNNRRIIMTVERSRKNKQNRPQIIQNHMQNHESLNTKPAARHLDKYSESFQYRSHNIKQMMEQVSMRRQCQAAQKQHKLLKKTMQKLIRIVDSRKNRQQHQKLPSKPMKMYKQMNHSINSVVNGVTTHNQQSHRRSQHQKHQQQQILLKINNKMQLKQRILLQKTQKISASLQYKRLKLAQLQKRREAQKQTRIDRSNKLEQQNIEQAHKKNSQSAADNIRKQLVVLKCHENVLNREKNRDRCIELRHCSDQQLRRQVEIIGTANNNKVG